MSNAGIFLYGVFVTLVVCAAFAVLGYGILLDKRDLEAEDRRDEGGAPDEEAGRVIEFPARPGVHQDDDAPAPAPQAEPAAQGLREPARRSEAAA